MSTNVPAPAFTPTGLVVPTEAEILAGVQQDFNDAFGGNLNPALNTPQGQLASSTAAIVADADNTFSEFVNQVDPDTADGFMQDAIARIYFLNRSPGEPTSVILTLLGDPGTPIPVGAQAADTNNNRYVNTLAGVIPVGGTIDLPFANVLLGPIPAPMGTVIKIYQQIPGWDAVTNNADGVLGADVESRAAFEQRREQSVALNAHGSIDAIYAAVFDVPGVIDVYATENVTNAIVNTGATNYPLAPHSLYVAAVGGDPTAIANAIWTKKDVGCDYNGNTSVVITDTNYSPPQPTYTVKYEIPPALPIKFAVQIANSAGLPSNIVQLVQAAIIAAFTGADGSTRVRIGSLLLAAKFYPGVVAIGPEVSVLSILLGSSTPTLTSQLIGIDQAPTVVAGDIGVTLV